MLLSAVKSPMINHIYFELADPFNTNDVANTEVKKNWNGVAKEIYFKIYGKESKNDKERILLGVMECSLLGFAQGRKLGINPIDIMDRAGYLYSDMYCLLIDNEEYENDLTNMNQLLMVDNLYIEPEYRGQRIGSRALKLISRAVEHIFIVTIDYLALCVCPIYKGINGEFEVDCDETLSDRKKRLLGFYEMNGFTLINKETDFEDNIYVLKKAV